MSAPTMPSPARTTDEMEQKLAEFPAFEGGSPEELALAAARCEEIACSAGDVLLRPGEMPGHLFFLRSGRAVVEAMGRVQSRLLAELGPGDCLPIEALYEQRPVFSTFRIVEDATLLRLTAEAFYEVLETCPTFRAFCEERSGALMDQTRRLYQRQFTLGRGDYQSLDSPLSSIVRTRPVTAQPGTPVRRVLEAMAERRAEVAVVTDAGERPVGIFTLNDLLHRIALGGYPQDGAIDGVMTPDPKTLAGTVLGSEAAVEMAQHGHRQILVVEDGRLIGQVSERDLFGLQRVGLAQIALTIRQAASIEQLERCAEEVRRLSHNLLDQGVRAEQLTRIISALNDQMSERTIALAERAFDLDGIAYCWLALGSEGRGEQTMTTDQDNAIIFRAEGRSADAVRERLLPFARHVNACLDRLGFPLCKGEIMAGNPKWCLSLEEWVALFLGWIKTPAPEALLNSTIFFDFRPLLGEAALATELRRQIAGPAQANRRFLHLMAENAFQRSPPLGLVRDFVTAKDGTIDLKLSGIAVIVDAARIMALAHGVGEANTHRRLRLGGAARRLPEKEIASWLDAFDFLQHLRLRIQHDQFVQGQPVTNKVNPTTLSDLDRQFLLQALRQAAKLQKGLQTYKLAGTV